MGRMGCAEAVGSYRWLSAPDLRRHAQAGATSGSSQVCLRHARTARDQIKVRPGSWSLSGGGACGGRRRRCRAARPRARHAGPQNHGMPCGGADGIRAAQGSERRMHLIDQIRQFLILTVSTYLIPRARATGTTRCSAACARWKWARVRCGGARNAGARGGCCGRVMGPGARSQRAR